MIGTSRVLRAGRDPRDTPDSTPEAVRVELLGGFRVSLGSRAVEEAAANARRLGEPAAYRAAIELYAGELLPRDRYEEWAEERRERLRRDHLALLVELTRLHEAAGNSTRP